MQGCEIIEENGITYAIVIRRHFESGEKYNFLTPPEYHLQLGVNFYVAGENIARHFHPPKDVKITSVQEFILVHRGRVRLNLFNRELVRIRQVELADGDMVLLVDGGHGFDVLEETTIFEVKQGPHDGASDKVRF